VFEDRGLDGIGGRRVLRVPLDAEVPALMILESYRLDDPVRGVRGGNQPTAQGRDALVVRARNGGLTANDLTERGVSSTSRAWTRFR
jgi:hypothetical protein